MNKLNYSRKDFLKIMGLGAAALTIPGYKLFADSKYLPNLGIQLYTVRKAIETDFEGTIKRVAGIGYKGVETYFLPEKITLDYGAKILKDAGLEVFAMHAELPVGENREMALKMADAYKCDKVVYHGWPPNDRYKNLDSLKHIVEVYNEAAELLKTKGLKLGFHNHWFELEKNDDGIYPLYYLMENLDKSTFFEIDTYWAKTAGLDPAKVVADFGSRVQMLHIKDGPAIKGDYNDKNIPMYKHVPAGDGTLDFPAIVKAGGENIKWMIVEFDEYDKDIFDGIKKSYEYLTKNELAKGKA